MCLRLLPRSLTPKRCRLNHVSWVNGLISGPSDILSYVASTTSPSAPLPSIPPIKLAPKGRRMSPATKQKFRPNTLFDDRGFPDEQTHWESMVPITSSGRLIRKRFHQAPNVESVDPNFGEVFDPVLCGPELEKLDLSHLTFY